MQTSVCAIILTKNEEIHLKRVLEQLSKLQIPVLIVDSGSTDNTLKIAKQYSCMTVFNKWKNHATQFNFGIEYLNNKYSWILRIDADEFFENLEFVISLIKRIKNGEYKKINGISFYRRINFLGSKITYGGIFPISVVRLFRSGYGVCENRWMDEHIIVSGNIVHEKVMIIDDNKMGFEFWLNKHINYAKKEAIEMLFAEYGLTSKVTSFKKNLQAEIKRNVKEKYYMNLPLFIRPLIYFMYRFFFRLGFLDGKTGFLYHFFHAFWYRLTVDLFIFLTKSEYKKENDIKMAIKKVLKIDA